MKEHRETFNLVILTSMNTTQEFLKALKDICSGKAIYKNRFRQILDYKEK